MLGTFSLEVVGFEQLKNLYREDPYFSKIVARCTPDDQDPMGEYVLHDGYLFRGVRLCIPELREKIISELHGGGLGGHFGRNKTWALIE